MRVLLLSALLCPSAALAFSIGSAVSHPCHEQISLLAFEDALAEVAPPETPLNEGEEWEAVRRTLGRTLEVGRFAPRMRDFAVVLVTGVRAPDVEGAASLDLGTMRERHLDPHGQHPHALRRPEDDGPDGDRLAVEAARDWIRERVALAHEALRKPASEQYVETEVWLDFRRLVTVRAWAPAFHLGEALHTAQDSFAHALRSPDQRRVRRVLNYIEATGGDYDASRDGLPHSMDLDACTFETAPEVVAAREASYQLLRAWRHGPEAVDAWLDRWFRLDDPCADDCDEDAGQTAPLPQETASKGCAAAGAGGLLSLLVLLGRRRTALAMLSLTGCLAAPASPALPDFASLCTLPPHRDCDTSVAGNWYASGACEQTFASLEWNDCASAWVSERLVAVGAMRLEEDGSVHNALEVARRRQVGFDKTCLTASGRCEDVLSPLGEQPCTDVGDACVCPVDDEPLVQEGGSGRWSREGELLRIALDSGETLEGEACSHGEVMHLKRGAEGLVFVGR